MEIKKMESSGEWSDISINDGNKRFQIIYGDNGDLYWYAVDLDQEKNSEVDFLITKENYMLYSLFERLYSGIRDCQVFSVSDAEIEACETGEDIKKLYERVDNSNNRLRTISNHNLLFNNGVVSWHSDNAEYYLANVFRICKDEDSFLVKFIPGRECNPYEMISVRISNSGSTYKPFNNLFMEMFNSLQEYDPNYHQIHVEEYLYEQKVKKLGSK